ncbi:ankyrin repeat domain-containing protein 11-like isoform X1 [Sabethes cyaneus]|uniref:ankyrin repeat domain-containing protein 11-like isoform X1 n=1 Tax=Sabethes cyaneus TaxID=53552 RepID=UPI00237DB411|nr:ankyrin repeat domain-containing protein 11-like isoform X1 [Sabethes cyaneus]
MNNFPKKDVSGMPSTSRPRGMSGPGSSGSGRPTVTTPMSERQQMALLMQMTSTSAGNEGDMSPGSAGSATSGSGGAHSRRDRINERGETALHLSAKKGDQETVKKLLEQGSNPNVTDFAGWTPLHEACNHGHYNVALALVKAGANINATGLENDTPLHDAAIVGQLKLCKMLVERGADPGFKNQKGKAPCDVAAPAVYTFLLQARDNAANRLQQQMKKPSEGGNPKKNSNQDSDADDTASSSGGATSASMAPSAVNKDEDDIYEFKSTPKDSGSSSSDEKESNCDKNEKSTAEKNNASGGDGDSNPISGTSGSANSGSGNAGISKRPFSEVSDPLEDSSSAPNDDDNKRKKRKDSDTTNKETTKGGAGANRGSAPRLEKSSKSSGPPSKNLSLAGKSALDRKSPCASPKPSTGSTVGSTSKGSTNSNANDSDVEGDDSSNKNSDTSFPSGGGPKVPPLKIVIPQQNTSGDADAGGSSRNGKNASARNHAALPYVVASSNSNDSSADKESTSSRSASPSDSKSSDEKTTSKSSEDRAQARVLRSHRGGGTGSSEGDRSRSKDNQSDRSVDRSNNSSPQLQQSSAVPSPASNSGDAAVGGGAGGGSCSSTGGGTSSKDSNHASPAGGNQKETETENGTNCGSNNNPKSPPVSTTSSTSTTTTTSSTSGASTSSTLNQNNQSTSTSSSTTLETAVHPRKRKIKTSKETSSTTSSSSSAVSTSTASASSSNEEKKEIKDETPDVHPHDQPITNCYQMFLNIRRQIERRQRCLFPVQPKPPQGFKDYLLNRCAYALAGKTPSEPNIQPPATLQPQMKDIFTLQEKERHKLKMQHIVEKEKLVLAVEQEILRVHGRAARALANQSLPFSVCTILKDEEVYNIITPEQEEKDRNARSRYNGRLFLSWLQDVDDKWEKIKEAMLLRHHNEAESLHAVQKMDWEWKMKENSLCEFKAKPVIDDVHVPMVNVSDDFDLLPA